MAHLLHHQDTEEDQVIYGVPEHYIGSLLPNTGVQHFNDDDDYDWRRHQESQEDTEEDGMSYLEVDSAYWRKKRRLSGSKTQDSEAAEGNFADRAMQGVFSMFAKYDQQASQQHQYSQQLSMVRQVDMAQQDSKPWEVSSMHSMASTLPSQQTNISALTMSAEKVGARVDMMGIPVMSGLGPSSRNPFTVVDTPYHRTAFNYDEDPGTIVADGIAAMGETLDPADPDLSVAVINPRKNLDFGQSPGPSSGKKQSFNVTRLSEIPSMNPLPRRSLDASHTPRHLNRQVAMDSVRQTSYGEIIDLDRPAHWGSARKSNPPPASAKKKQIATPKSNTLGEQRQNSSSKRPLAAAIPMEVPLPKSAIKALPSSGTQAMSATGSSAKTVSFTPAWIRSKSRLSPSSLSSGGDAPGRNASAGAGGAYIASASDDIVEDRSDFLSTTSYDHQGHALSMQQQRGAYVQSANRSMTTMTAMDNYHEGSPSIGVGHMAEVNVSPFGKSRSKGSAAKRSLLWRLQKFNREEEDAKVVLSELSKNPNNKSMQHLHPKNKAKLILTIEILDLLDDLDSFSVFKVRVIQRISHNSTTSMPVSQQLVSINTTNQHNAIHGSFHPADDDLEQSEQPVLHPSSFLPDDEEHEEDNDSQSHQTIALLLLGKTPKQSSVHALTSYQHVNFFDPAELPSVVFKDPFLPIARLIGQDRSVKKIIIGSTLWEII